MSETTGLDTPCSKCGVSLRPYFLKDGICNGCRNPDLIVEAVPAPCEHRDPLDKHGQCSWCGADMSDYLAGESDWLYEQERDRRTLEGTCPQ